MHLEAAAFRDAVVQTPEYHYQVEEASRAEAGAAQAFPDEAERAVLSSSARAEVAPSASVQTAAAEPGKAEAVLPRA